MPGILAVTLVLLLGSRLISASQILPSLPFAAIASTLGRVILSNLYTPALKLIGSNVAS